MADTTTELEVLDEIVEVLGGQSGQYETVVPTLQQILALLGGGGGGGGGGYNPSLSVGRADALTGADSTAQWATRESTGSGAATVRSVQGAAVAWNQLLDGRTYGGWSNTGNMSQTYDIATKTTKLQSTTDDTAAKYTRTQYNIWGELQANRTYLYKAFVDATHCSQPPYISIGSNAKDSVAAGTARYAAVILTTTETSNLHQALNSTEPSGGYAEFSDVQLFDLTLMFGAGNEPATVAEFERMYPEPYYPYSAPTLKPVQISGIRSTTAQGGELDSVEWEAQTLRAAGSVRDELTAGELMTRVGVVDLGTLEWRLESLTGIFEANIADMRNPTIMTERVDGLSCALYPIDTNIVISDQMTDKTMKRAYNNVYIRDTSYTTVADFKSAMSGVLLFYELATPTTTPISPALPMTYKVQAGGSESIIVPDGEVSAAPVLTVAEGESAAELVMDALACIATPDGPTATANHAVGTYLTMQGKLYKVTSAIAVGESIVAGTNVTETTVMAEVLSLIQ